jgi:hypothetical protein
MNYKSTKYPASDNSIFLRAPVNSQNSAFPMKYVKNFTILFIVFVLSVHSKAQVSDSAKVIKEKEYNNTIKINLTSWILYSNGVQLNYERILSKKRSFTIFGGIIQFPVPSAIANSSITFDNNTKSSGYTFGADYRFYLAKENKYAAPHGIYLAPFISYYHFNVQRTGHDTTNQDNLTLNASFGFVNIGGEMGYQFVIKNRFVIDCVLLGPALSSYNFNIKLGGSTSGDYNEKVQAILEAIKDKYPLLKQLSSDSGVSKNGISDFWSLGFRYAIHIGYRF